MPRQALQAEQYRQLNSNPEGAVSVYTQAVIPLAREGDGIIRAEFTTALTSIAAWLATHDGVPLPLSGGRLFMQVPVPRGPRAERVEAMQGIAALLGTAVVPGERGVLYALREFGPVRYGAALAPEGSAHLAAAMLPGASA